ncbi:chorismate mutase [Candidatus Gottesmanbacteria bacterium]|nr:chorismate mutase [Candidatus Gottesmanbacteria bacterium]
MTKEKCMNLNGLRLEIDKMDKRIIFLLKRRLAITKKIAMVKKKNNLPVEDTNRENGVISNIKFLANLYELDSSWLIAIFNLIIQKSKEEQIKRLC